MNVLANFMNTEIETTSILKTLQRYELADINSRSFEITRIISGAINKNFKVFDGNKTLLLKVFSRKIGLPIDRREVFNMQEELAILGLAPVPFFLSRDCTIYCEQWIDAPKNTGIQKSNRCVTSLTNTLAEVLYSVHNSSVSAQLVELDKHWQFYWQKLKSPGQALQEKYRQVKHQWQDYKEHNLDHFVVCHNDLHIDHISFLHGPVFDWEYAGLGCRYFDIANCCAINELSQAEIANLCSRYAYFANQEPSHVIQRVQEVSDIAAFTTQLWTESLGIGENPK
jgi:thiamine kinase-like enzyme